MDTEHETSLNQTGDRHNGRSSAAAKIQPKHSGKRWGLAVGILCAAIVLGIFWATSHFTPARKTTESTRTGPVAVPVVAGKVAQKDVPVYFDGLGTVQAFNTVTIHARVDGQLVKVAFAEGQDVRVGDLLAKIDPAPFKAALAQAEAKKRQDEAQLANARLDLKRNAELVAQKIASQQVYDTQQALVSQLEAGVKADQAAIDSAKVQLDYTTIVSPLEGRVGIRLVDQGNIVHASDQNGLVVITQLRPISVLVTLPEQTLREIQKERSQAELTVLAVDRDNKTVLDEGKLVVIDNQIDVATGTIKLKATFANKDLQLWPGQFVNARLLVTTRKGAIVVSAAVIQRGPEGSYAFVIKDDSTVEVRPVKVAFIEDGQAVIDEGLRSGERVVVEGQYRLQAGSKGKPRTAGKPADADGEQ
jgi:membrane fusion protein, multidrug efflux system